MAENLSLVMCSVRRREGLASEALEEGVAAATAEVVAAFRKCSTSDRDAPAYKFLLFHLFAPPMQIRKSSSTAFLISSAANKPRLPPHSEISRWGAGRCLPKRRGQN